MARKSKVKISKNFSLKQLQRQMNQIMVDGLNVMGRNINLEIQKNTAAGRDINGDKFQKLSDSTKEERALLGFSGPPLNRTGTMKETSFTRATTANPVFTIEMTGASERNGEIYGAYHNQGFVNSAKSRFPGTKVPKREWFGIPKNMQPGKPGYQRAMMEIDKRIDSAFSTHFHVVGQYKK